MSNLAPARRPTAPAPGYRVGAYPVVPQRSADATQYLPPTSAASVAPRRKPTRRREALSRAIDRTISALALLVAAAALVVAATRG